MEADSAREAGRSAPAPAGAAECVGDLFFWLSGDLVMAGEVILENRRATIIQLQASAITVIALANIHSTMPSAIEVDAVGLYTDSWLY